MIRRRALDACVEISTNDPDFEDAVAATFVDLPPGDLSLAAHRIDVEIVGTRARVVEGERSDEVDVNAALRSVVSRVNAVAAKSTSPVLHAGAFEVEGVVVVVAGRSGSGKSTTVAAAAEDGFGYLADELVAIRASERVEGYPKALTLKNGTWPVIKSSRYLGPDAHQRFVSDVTFVPPEHLGAASVAGGAPALLVFPTWRSTGGVEWAELSSVDALRLVVETAYAPLSAESFEALADFVSTVPAVKLENEGVVAPDGWRRAVAAKAPSRLERLPALRIGSVEVVGAASPLGAVGFSPSSGILAVLDISAVDYWQAVASGQEDHPFCETLADALGISRA